ncbi:MAG: FixH family protein [Thiomargarita sp.]|nr:FixH family protein [Thiomargarita sp.]
MKPWYQEPFVWLIILFPASAVIGGMFTIFLAIDSNDGLVVDDYYKQGLEINRTLERDKAALEHGLQATLNVKNKFIQITLNANDNYTLPSEITLQFSYSTRSGFDKQIVLKRINDSTYQSDLPELITGKFFMRLMADDWRLSKSAYFPIEQETFNIDN